MDENVGCIKNRIEVILSNGEYTNKFTNCVSLYDELTIAAKAINENLKSDQVLITPQMISDELVVTLNDEVIFTINNDSLERFRLKKTLEDIINLIASEVNNNVENLREYNEDGNAGVMIGLYFWIKYQVSHWATKMEYGEILVSLSSDKKNIAILLDGRAINITYDEVIEWIK